jgi:tRNA(Ile)-lysidine synthase
MIRQGFEATVRAGLGSWPGGTVFLAAVSGGVDSTAMLAALSSMRRDEGFVLHCLHVEHGMRPSPESLGDAAAVQDLCGSLEIPCTVVSIPQGKVAAVSARLGIGPEAAARLYRRRIWNREARRLGAAGVLVAHTADDLLETVLMRVLRGAGPAGLAAMPPRRGLVIRPLLNLNRADVLAYLEERRLSYRTDSTNADLRYFRNRVRHKLVPCLDSFFPFWRTSLKALGETQALAADFLSAEAGRILREKTGSGGTPGRKAGRIRFLWDIFLKEAPILQEEAVFLAADILAAGQKRAGGCVRVPRRRSLRQVLGKLREGSAAGDLGPLRMERQGNSLVLKAAGHGTGSGGFSLLIRKKGSYTLKKKYIKKYIIEVGKSTANSEAAGTKEEKNFFALLPLVLRPCRRSEAVSGLGQKNMISAIIEKEAGDEKFIAAEDRRGIAAVIGAGEGRLLYRREKIPLAEVFTIRPAKEV